MFTIFEDSGIGGPIFSPDFELFPDPTRSPVSGGSPTHRHTGTFHHVTGRGVCHLERIRAINWYSYLVLSFGLPHNRL